MEMRICDRLFGIIITQAQGITVGSTRTWRQINVQLYQKTRTLSEDQVNVYIIYFMK